MPRHKTRDCRGGRKADVMQITMSLEQIFLDGEYF